MTTSLNAVADALEQVVGSALEEAINAYSEPQEAPHDPAVEMVLLSRVRISNCKVLTRWIAEVSATADDRGWQGAVRLIRTFIDQHEGSVEAAIKANRTLGIEGCNAQVVEAGNERLATFGKAKRWTADVQVEVTY